MANENKFINIYFLAGGTNDEGAIDTTIGTETALSSEGSQTNPLTVTINSSNNQAIYRKCGIRTTTGHETSGDVTISFTGGSQIAGQSDATKTTHLCWRIAKTKGELETAGIDQSSMLTMTDPDVPANKMKLTFTEADDGKITATANKLFYIMVLAASDETPMVDRGVSIVTTATIAATDTGTTP